MSLFKKIVINILIGSFLLLVTPISFAGVGFTISNVTLQEDSGTTAIQVDLVDDFSAFGVSIIQVSVDYAVTGGTATAGSDFTALSGTLDFTSAGSQTFNLTLLEDLDVGPNETIIITLSNCIEDQLDGAGLDICGTFSRLDAVQITGATETITIVDTTTPGTLNVSSPTASIVEGGNATIMVSRTGGSDGIVSIDYATADVNAVAGSDYTAASGTLTWADGDTANKSFTISALIDVVVDANETFTANLSNITGNATLGSIPTATITILDTTTPGAINFSSSTASVAEGGSVTISATRTGGSDGAVSIDFSTADGSALAGSDYTATSGTLNWADGDTSDKTFTITASADAVIDINETFMAALSNVTGGAAIGTVSTAVVTIVDTTTPGTINLSSSAASVTEGGIVTIMATRTGGSDGAVSIDFATADGSALAGSDYKATSGTLNWADGDASDKTFTISSSSDVLVEGDETLSATLSNVSGGATLGSVSVSTITITDATTPGAINLSSSAASVAEGGTVTITATRTGGSDGAVSIDFATADGSALAGSDYTATSGTLNWADGDISDKTFTITSSSDVLVEGDETLSATLSNVSGGATLGSVSVSTITITDATTPGAINLSSSTASVAEGGTVTITATRTGGSDGAVSIDFATADGSALAGSDYTATSGTLNWADGDISDKTFTITSSSDVLVEGDETLSATLSNVSGGATLGSISVSTITITDASTPGAINLSSSTTSVAEGGIVTITATRTGGSDGAVSIDFATADGSALAGSDYTATSGTLNWADGDISDKTFTITSSSDVLVEGDETLSATLSNVSGGATLGSVSISTITITDASAPGAINLSSSTASVAEGGTVTITATRTGGSGGAVSIDFATANGSALAGSDYTATSGTLNWADGDISDKSFTITSSSDVLVEGDETLSATLSNVSGGATLGSVSVSTITITDASTPGAINLSRSTASVAEGGTVTITATRTGGSDGAVSIDFSTANGSALAGSDYTATSGTLNWADGDISDKSFTITSSSDVLVEGDETLSATLSNVSGGATLGSVSVSTITITDASTPGAINLSSSSASVAEGGTVTITATRTGGSGGAVSIDFATANGSALAGSDYTATSGTLNWADGDISDKSFTITSSSDVLVEGDETLSATLSNVSSGATLGSISVSTITITDASTPGAINLSSSTASVAEGGTVTITATRTGGSGGAVSIDFATADGSALAGSDYTATSGTLNWADGDISDKTFTISSSSDVLVEGDETLSVTLSNVSGGATLGSISVSTITITDASTPGTINLITSTTDVAEGETKTFTVTRTGGSDGAVSIDYATTDGSALAGSDYTTTSGILNWADGDSSNKTFTITVLVDNVIDENETFSVTLSNITGGAILGSIPSVTITVLESTQRLSDIQGLTEEQQSVAKAIDELCDAATGDLLRQCQDINTSNLSDEELVEIIDVITPTQISSQGSNAIDFGFQQLQVVHGRIVSLRQKDKKGDRISLAGFTMTSFGQQIPFGKMAEVLIYNALDEVGGEQSLRDSPLGFFLKGNVTIGEKEATRLEKGFDVDSKSITFGLDYQFTDKFVLGIASGYAHSNNDFANNGGEMESHSGSFSIYGSYFLPKDFYVDMIVSYAIHNYDNARTISFSGLQTTATSNTFGDQYGGSLGFGKDFYVSNFFMSPYVRIEYLTTGIDEYTEQGGGAFALRVNEQSISSLASTLGGQINRAISMPWGIISPGLRFEWRHQFRDNQRTIQSQFINAPTGTGIFSIRTDDPDRDYFNLGGSIAITLPEGKSAFLRYETRLGQDDITNHTIEAAIRIPF